MSKASNSSSLSIAVCWLSALLIVNVTNASAAEETIGLGNGSSLTVTEYQIETAPDGYKTIVVLAVPNFDPEPFGQVPSDDYARLVRPLCGNLLANSAAELEAQDISAVRVRWDFKPTKPPEDTPANITLSRFHEMVFEVANDLPCIPRPLGVGMDNLTPQLSSDIKATLRWAEPGLNPGELSLTYAVESGLGDISIAALDRAAIELCILHADLLLDARARYYSQLASRTVAITFEQNDEKPGFALVRRVTFPVENGQCATGLSEMLTEAIRNK